MTLFLNGILLLKIDLALFDTAGQEDYDRLRPLSYPDTNIILICFSIDSSVSATSVIEKWMPEVRHFCGQCPVILVACKKDLRTDPQTIAKLKREGENLVTTDVGRQIARQIKADAYMECSAKTREGVQELFIHAARLSLKKYTPYKKIHKCNLH
jgi:small GTP-binding protein